MASVVRWSPMRDRIEWRGDFDRFFRDFLSEGPSAFEGGADCLCPRVESFRHNGSFIVKAELPGVNPQDVRLTAEGGVLTIEGERKRKEEISGNEIVEDEICYGSFRRTLDLPEGVKTDQMKAKYHDGILEITAPVEEHYLPRKIEVEVHS